MRTYSGNGLSGSVITEITNRPLEDLNETELRKALISYQVASARELRTLDYSRSKLFENVARYTPALSEGYIQTVERLGQLEAQSELDDKPELNPFRDLSIGAEDLKFINPNSRLCFYPWVLFSGGQGAKTASAAKKTNWVTAKPRDPRVVLIGDSGGFQIQEQTIPFDPEETPERMLRWLEAVADLAMVLDFPTGGISSGAMVAHVDQLTKEGIDVYAIAKREGFSSGFIAALTRTLQNNDHFRDHRIPAATKFLNVIQGRNEEESRHWYRKVRHYPFEGWAFAGKHSVQLTMTLRRLIEMRDDGKLSSNTHIHFLGVSTLKVGCALTLIQRVLRTHTEATGAQITFDSKSPVDAMVNGYQAIVGYELSRDSWSVRTATVNKPEYAESEVPLIYSASDWLTEKRHRYLPRSTLGCMLPQKALVGKVNSGSPKRTPSSLQQVLLVHHNTQALIEAFRDAYRLLEPKSAPYRPEPIAHLDSYIEQVFSAPDPFTVIDKCAPQLDALSYEGAFGP